MKRIIHNLIAARQTHGPRDGGMRAPECLMWSEGRRWMCVVSLLRPTVRAAAASQTLYKSLLKYLLQPKIHPH